MIVTTTPSIEGRFITGSKGFVTGEVRLGATLSRGLGADVVVGVDQGDALVNNMLMVSASGTAVTPG